MPETRRVDHPRLGQARLLAEAGKRVIFPENRDHRPACARLADNSGGDTGHALRDPEPFGPQHGCVFGTGPDLSIGDFRHVEHAIGQSDEGLTLGVHMGPDRILVRLGHSQILQIRAMSDMPER